MTLVNYDDWGIRKYDNIQLIAVLRNPLAGEEAIQIAITEALARLLTNTKEKE